MTDTEFGRTILYERQRRGMSIRTLRDKSGVSAIQISRIERGVTSPPLRTMNALARALGLHLKLTLTKRGSRK